MKKNNFFQFKKLSKQKDLIHGVFGRDFGNVSFEYGDKKEILSNRKKIAKVLDINMKNIYEMDQVHESNIKMLRYRDIEQLRNNIIPMTDALITDEKNVFLMIKTADCFPVVFFDQVKKVIAAVHVGWRGAIEKIFLVVLLKMIDNLDCRTKDILVGIGPGIGLCCFCHKNLIQRKLPEWEKFVKKEKDGWLSADIKNFIKEQLVQVGIKGKNIETIDICTSCSKDFFSHFRSLQTNKLEGRFATIIGLKK